MLYVFKWSAFQQTVIQIKNVVLPSALLKTFPDCLGDLFLSTICQNLIINISLKNHLR